MKTLKNKINTPKITAGRLVTENFAEFGAYLTVIEQLLEVPEGYALAEVQTDIYQSSEEVLRFRFTFGGKPSVLYEEHFSVVLRASDKLLLGFTAMTLESEYSETKKLPDRQTTIELTERFLNKVAPGYLAQIENLWIDQHDERIWLDGVERTLSGTKYKAFVPSQTDYAWVIVNHKNEVIVFERNIRWVKGRTTEKWLHDSYLENGTLDLNPVRLTQ